LIKKYLQNKYPKFNIIDYSIKKGGWRVILLIRLNPLFPFNLTNYILSLTSINIFEYTISTFIGKLPGHTIYTLIGWFSGNLSDIIDGKSLLKWWHQLLLFGISGI